ncbi:type IV pilin protein, partial [Pseudomonas sp. CCC2.2]|uniref:type IV pilin protein n=1 Tax=Pseudomonas sp. CCC2.2 TaxID=3048605 RepID=UPI002B22CDC4
MELHARDATVNEANIFGYVGFMARLQFYHNDGTMDFCCTTEEECKQMSIHPTRKNQGFTLIEILITVTIVGILTAIALPSYSSYIVKSNIKAAQADLIALSLNLENSYQKQLVYPAATASTTAQAQCVLFNGTTTCTSPSSGWQPSQSANFNYTITSTTSTYTVGATGTSGNVNGCSITLTQDNTRAIASCSPYNGSWL